MWFDNLVNKLHRGKPVPPIAAPPPNNMQTSPFELPVPFALEEFPRTYLHSLLDSGIPDKFKVEIKTWLDEHDRNLTSYMHERYGEGADQVMEMITNSVVHHQDQAATAKNKAAENEVLAHLEKQLFEEGEGGEADGDGSTARS